MLNFPLSAAPRQIEFQVAEADATARIDVALALRLPEHSRAQIRRAIDAGCALVNGRAVRASHRLRVGEQIVFTVPDMPKAGPQPEEIPLEILYEDEHLAAVNKPPGMVVHPAKGHWKGTLASALVHHFQEQLSGVGGETRPGIVHRLDRDTSGVILVAKTDAAHAALADQFESRRVEKEYVAIVVGQPPHDRDWIDRPIGAHPYHREKMAIRQDHPTVRPAQTFYEVERRFDGFAIVKAQPKTGRTHQIRVHLASLGCPVLCDKLYGGRSRITVGEVTRRLNDETVALDRQALHARRLVIAHPVSGERLELTAPLPADLSAFVELLGRYRAG